MADDLPPDPRLLGAAPEDAGPEEVAASPTPAVADGPFRFAFEIDEAARLTHVSPELETAVGASASGIVGRSWDEISAANGLDPDGAVAAALSRQASWGDISVRWPLGDGRSRAIALSALPMFDRGRSFVGFRGLGRSLDDAVQIEEPTPQAPTAADLEDTPEAPAESVRHDAEPEAAKPEARDFEAEAPDASRSDAARPADAAPVSDAAGPAMVPETPDEPAFASGRPLPAEEPPILVEVEPPSPVFAGNVVPLRESAPLAASLSTSEESAFDEIARRLRGLGVRTDSEPPVSAVVPHELSAEQRALPFSANVEELTRVIDRLPVGALVLRGGEIAHANRMGLEMLGCRELEELSGRGADTLFAEALPPAREASAGAMRLISSDGGEIDVDARLSTISWGGSPATLVSLRRPEAAAAAAAESAERERELAATLDVATDGVMTLDGAGRILSVNRGAESLFGFSGREVIGSLFTLSLAPESRRAAFETLDRMKSGGEPNGGVEVMGLARQGGAAPLLMTIGRLPHAEDRYCAVLRDIGPWKRAEEELISARRQAERASAQKSDFLAKVSHEIRTPLNAIIGFAEVMRDERFGPIGSPRYKDYLRDIETSGAHLVKMMDDLMDVSRIESGKLKLDFAPVDLNEIASQAAALLQPQANRERVIIRTSLARGLPPVLADRRSVRQIMTNLAANAVRLSRPGGQVIVATSLTDVGQAVFRVRDAGAGLSKQELARAFEPFRPLGVADNDAGSGLGLPLTRALAEANEAALALQSELGHGTLAEVTFPASRVLAS